MGFYYHPSRHSAGQPIVAGWSYQWIAQLGLMRNSWTAPLDAQRIQPAQDVNSLAALQINRPSAPPGRQVRLPRRSYMANS